MKASSIFRTVTITAGLLSIFFFAGCEELNYPSQPYNGGYNGGYNDGGYNNGGYNNGGYDRSRSRDDSYRRDRDREYDRERHEERERERERDRDRQRDEERRRHEDAQRHQSPPQSSPPRQEFRCPPGTHPSTHRCSNEDRRKGCKDYGGPNGQGCSNF